MASSSSGPHSPSSRAARATACATATATLRRSATGGSRLAAGSSLRRRQVGERLGGRLEHAVAHAMGVDREHAQADARENIGVVGLVDGERLAIALDRRKWAAGADHGATFAPGFQILRRRFAARHRIGQRENHRPRGAAGHRAHDLFGEDAGLPGDADQRGRLGVRHHVEQADPVRMLASPIGDRRAPAERRAPESRADRGFLARAGRRGRPRRSAPSPPRRARRHRSSRAG